MILPIKYKLWNNKLWVRDENDEWLAIQWNVKSDVYIPITQNFGNDFRYNLSQHPEWKGKWFYKEIIGIPGHNGIDFKAPNGGKLYAPHDGKITELITYDGNAIRLRGKEYESVFYHLKSFNCSLNQEVKEGDFIGLTDNTGLYTTAPHLHWGVRPINWDKNDPYRGYMDFRGFIEDLEVHKLPYNNGQCLMRTEANGEFYVVEDGDLAYKSSDKQPDRHIPIVDYFIKQKDLGLPKGFIKSISEEEFKKFNNLIK